MTCIVSFVPPRNKKEIQRFIGLVNFYISQIFLKYPNLNRGSISTGLPKLDEPFNVQTNASKTGFEGIPSQKDRPIKTTGLFLIGIKQITTEFSNQTGMLGINYSCKKIRLSQSSTENILSLIITPLYCSLGNRS